MVSIRNFSGEAALSCWKVMPARRATSTKVTTVCEDGQTCGDAAKAIPAEPAYLSSSRLESVRTCVSEEILDSSVGPSQPPRPVSSGFQSRGSGKTNLSADLA